MTIRDEDKKMLFMREMCKENGLRLTPQRAIVYRELLKSDKHPTADMVYQAVRKILPNISFDTVNRTMLTFAQIGLLNVVEGYGEPKRYDPNINSHHHFRCIKCNKIIDFHNEQYDHLAIPGDIDNQFSVMNKRVVLEGLCDKCKE